MIRADWHTHTEASPNAALRAEDLCAAAAAQELAVIGMCDHCNYPDAQYRDVMRRSRAEYDRLRPGNPALRFGTELSPCPAGVCEALRARNPFRAAARAISRRKTAPLRPSWR